MVETVAQENDFNESVAQDRATMIREAAKNNKKEGSGAEMAMQSATGEATKSVIDKALLTANNFIWGMAVAILPLFGLTFLLSFLLILALLLKRLFTASLEEKGIKVEVGMGMMMYTWGTFLAQLLITVVIYAIIYMVVNPTGVLKEVLGV